MLTERVAPLGGTRSRRSPADSYLLFFVSNRDGGSVFAAVIISRCGFCYFGGGFLGGGFLGGGGGLGLFAVT